MDTGTKETLLFVDDEESILDLATIYFNRRGYAVLTACNGREAIDMLGGNRIDCCLTDLNMPEVNGLELAEYIRKYDNTIPVVVMTGFPSLDNTIHTLKNGVVDFLIKPINLNQMELSVQRVLRERRLFIENIMFRKKAEGKAKLEQLNRELTHRNNELNVLNRIMTDFSSLRESADVFRQLVDMTVKIVHADVSCFHLINASSDQSMVIATSMAPHLRHEGSGVGDPMALLNDIRIHRLIMDVMRDDQPLLISNNNRGGSIHSKLNSFMLAQLKIRSKILGVLSASVMTGQQRFNEKDLYHLTFMTNKAATAIENLALYENIYSNLLSTLYAFVTAIEARDPYTKEHSSRVTRLAIAMAKAMDRTNEDIEILNVASLLHDIGKIGIRDEILLKPGRLDENEYRIIKQHPVIGAEILDNLGLWRREKQIVRGHHERFDGTGYPDQLKGDAIPFLARILSIADVYDALASDRAYRQRMAEEKILHVIYSSAGSQFDPDIVDVFRKLYQSGDVTKLLDETD